MAEIYRITSVPPDAPCRCGHPGEVHTHLRPGTDCARCACSAFTRASAARRLLMQLRLHRRPARRDDGLTALLDAVMAEQSRGHCGCLACQVAEDEQGTGR